MIGTKIFRISRLTFLYFKVSLIDIKIKRLQKENSKIRDRVLYNVTTLKNHQEKLIAIAHEVYGIEA